MTASIQQVAEIIIAAGKPDIETSSIDFQEVTS